jgi:hypothetical protein
MSERERQQRLRVENALAELRSRHGDEVEWGQPPQPPELEPSWGPIGSLAARMLDPASQAALQALHQHMVAKERSLLGVGTAAPVGPVQRSVTEPPAPEGQFEATAIEQV